MISGEAGQPRRTSRSQSVQDADADAGAGAKFADPGTIAEAAGAANPELRRRRALAETVILRDTTMILSRFSFGVKSISKDVNTEEYSEKARSCLPKYAHLVHFGALLD